eukprot:TRINITY_DN34398_c0_g1_i1.p1 TRINITY_DN34398_c0_g1~~TRINITY_DN34398_c0_g1_i1.p1  ORF type:complete len:315 (-),score=48.71 TRINITY_DN34398_c0_g1_i1:171-974(-)
MEKGNTDVPLGMRLRFPVDNGLAITEIRKAGLIPLWNQTHDKHTDHQIQVGDVIVEVNGITLDCKRMLAEVSSQSMLSLTLRRCWPLQPQMEPAPEPAPECATMQVATAPLQEAMIGEDDSPRAPITTTEAVTEPLGKDNISIATDSSVAFSATTLKPFPQLRTIQAMERDPEDFILPSPVMSRGSVGENPMRLVASEGGPANEELRAGATAFGVRHDAMQELVVEGDDAHDWPLHGIMNPSDMLMEEAAVNHDPPRICKLAVCACA